MLFWLGVALLALFVIAVAIIEPDILVQVAEALGD